ncbi:MAG TPA: hypothetical protein VF169_01860 [Albitalea sp.]|uniref:hypothetical protein n=1 Tax=Piscinibacter sp. TaxID=1903157 RepID=UPI002ED12C37
MISRLSAFAALFAVITTASLAYAANVQQQQRAAANCEPTPVVQLERVMVTASRANLDL